RQGYPAGHECAPDHPSVRRRMWAMEAGCCAATRLVVFARLVRLPSALYRQETASDLPALAPLLAPTPGRIAPVTSPDLASADCFRGGRYAACCTRRPLPAHLA